jgi:DNA-binding beta-propeller fold protein YncE
VRRGARSGVCVRILIAACVWSSTAPALSQEPRFVRRLSLPAAGDQIGFGTSVTVDLHTGEIFVCDARTNRILVFDREGRFDTQIILGREISGPRDLAVDADGLLLVLAAHDGRVVPLELDFDGLFRREIPLRGLPEGSEVPSPVSVALSPKGDRVYVLDIANRALWIADRDGLVLAAIDLAAGLSEPMIEDLLLGHVDVYGDAVLVAIPSIGRILVRDLEGADRGGVGVKGGARCQLGRPNAAALGRDGNLLVIDRQRMVLTRWSPSRNRCLSEHLGIGRAPGLLYYPYDLALDAQGRLFIAQSFEGRVQVYEGLVAAASPPAAMGGVGRPPNAP